MGACIMRFTGFFFLIMALPVSAFTATLYTGVTGAGSIHGPGIDCPGDCTREYETGSVVTLRADPDRGWEFAGWSGDAAGSESTIQVFMDGDRSVFALFTEEADEEYTITAAAGAGGSIFPSGEVRVSEDSSRSFSIVPYGGYQIADVSVDGASVGAVDSYTFRDIDGDHTIYATFSLATLYYSITASAGDGGTISPSGTVVVSRGASQTFAIIPADGYRVSDVVVDGASRGPATSYTFSDVSADHSISASFVPEPVVYTITASAEAGGTIFLSGEVRVSGGGSRSFIITPDSGFRIEDVVVDGTSVGPRSIYTFSDVQAGHTILALFERSSVSYSITATARAGGTIDPPGTVTVPEGEDLRFTITPESGYHIADVLVDDSSVGAVSSYTFRSVSSGHTIQAVFEITMVKTYTITATAGTGGSINPSGMVTVAEGDSQSFSISPDAGFQIGDVLADGTSVGKATQYTFRDVRADHSIGASFLSVSGTYGLNVTASEGGSVSIDPQGRTFAPGTGITLLAVPSSGYAFGGWSGDLTGRENPAVVVMDSDKTINAEFLLDQDIDGEGDTEEWGPDGTDVDYDGNGDGLPDSGQSNVVSLHTYDGSYYLTIEGPEGSAFSGTAVSALPEGAPGGYSYPYGLLQFRITGIQPGSAVRVRIFLRPGDTITTYYKYNPDEGKWEDFPYDRESGTGVQINNSIITMNFIDGGRGDQDGAADGIITDPGTMAVKHQSKSWYDRCFISAAGSPSNRHGAWTALLSLAVFALSRKRDVQG
jgi:predicted ester cyclase